MSSHFASSFPSSSYQLLSIIRGQNEAFLDLRKRIYNDCPNSRKFFQSPLKVSTPVDIAACYLMIKELKGIITDSCGISLDKIPLWSFKNNQWSSHPQISLISTNNSILHQKIINKINKGFENLKHEISKKSKQFKSNEFDNISKERIEKIKKITALNKKIKDF